MANETKRLSNVATVSVAYSGDRVLIVANAASNAQTHTIDVADLLGNSHVTVRANVFVMRQGETPANSTANCEVGQMFWDSSYLYVAVANNQLKRVSLSSF